MMCNVYFESVLEPEVDSSFLHFAYYLWGFSLFQEVPPGAPSSRTGCCSSLTTRKEQEKDTLPRDGRVQKGRHMLAFCRHRALHHYIFA